MSFDFDIDSENDNPSIQLLISSHMSGSDMPQTHRILNPKLGGGPILGLPVHHRQTRP